MQKHLERKSKKGEEMRFVPFAGNARCCCLRFISVFLVTV